MKNYTHQPLGKLKNVKYIHLLTTIFGSADLAYMQLISKFNEGFRFLLYVSNIYSKYAWVFTLKDKNGVAIANVFKKILDGPHRKLSKILVNKSSEFYIKLLKSWLQDNDIAIYSTHNEGKSAVAERFIRTFKN